MQLLKQKGFCAYLAVAAICLTPAVLAAADTNAVQMVTYFPVPYAQYNNLYPQKKLDIGTVDGQDFKLTIGSCAGESAPAPFTADTVNLRKAAGTQTLNMQQNFKTTKATFGNTDDDTGLSSVSFANVYLSDTALTVPELQATVLKAASPGNIHVLKSALPDGCASGRVQWVELNFGTNKKYLVCCEQDGSNCASPCQGMAELERTCKGGKPDLAHNNITDTSAGSNGPAIITAASLASYQKTGTWDSNNCSCSCPNGSHGGNVAGSSLFHNGQENENDYDFCMKNCWWDEISGGSGRVNACTSATWTNPANANDVRTVGAKWNYDNCTCNCSHSNSDYKNVDNYTCTHKCNSYYQNGTVATCLAGSSKGWSWNDGNGTCKCDCGDYNIYKQSGKLCVDKCVKDNPTWNSTVTKCTSSGGTWRGENGSPSCTCNCGKTASGKNRVLQNGVCLDPE